MQSEIADIGFLDELIPIAFAVCITVIVLITMWLVYRLKVSRINALRQALADRPDLEPNTLRQIIMAPNDPQSDFRRFTINIAISAAVVVLAFCLPASARLSVLGLATFPGFIGIAYLALYLGRTRRSGQ